jgi:hypothetical protein
LEVSMTRGAVFLTYMVLAAVAAAEEPRAAGRLTLADVAFLAGHWTDETPQGLSEEIWTAPQGDGMLGMWRYVASGRAQIFELLSIRQEENGPVLRLRHFDPGLVAREEKDAPVRIPLVKATPDEAVFEGRSTAAGPLRLTYRKQGPDALAVTLEKDGGKPQLFRLRRAGTK